MSSKVYNIRRLLGHTNVSSSLVKKLLYTDDCDIVTHFEDEMQCFMNRFAHACKAFGLEINLQKTVIWPALPNIEPAEGKKLNVVHFLVYLDSTLAEGYSFWQDLFMHWKSFWILLGSWKTWSIKHVFWCPSCMQVKYRCCISTNWGLLNAFIDDACDKYFVLDSDRISHIQKY